MQETPFNWICPFCAKSTTITSINACTNFIYLDIIGSQNPDYSLYGEAICCPNPQCGQVTLRTEFYQNGWKPSGTGRIWGFTEKLNEWSLLPRSMAKPVPDFVPEEIRKNYEEACLIQNDSPKASAAMSRRCLQGIVRDFWDIPANKRGNLGAEINYIREEIDEDTFESIKAVREVGDIGAHMEKSVDTIVDVEPEEAGLLIELIETLISDWYVAKNKRANRNKALQATVAAKRAAKKLSKENTKNQSA